jgi:anti-sigma factor RsiW
MIDSSPNVTEDELHAFFDGELPPDRRGVVESWLASHPEDVAQLAAWRAQAEAVRAHYGAVANEPIPARLQLNRLDRTRRSWIGVAAAAVLIAFLGGGVAGWMARGASAAAPDQIEIVTTDALHAYKLYVVEVRHPVEVPGAERPHLVQWLSKRLGYELRLPNPEPMGLKLVGGRLLPGPTGRPAAFFMYESASGERFTLYYTRAAVAEAAMHYTQSGSSGAIYWVDRNLSYVLSGPNDHTRLRSLAQKIYDQLDTRAAVPG